jgi:hypothetical protein
VNRNNPPSPERLSNIVSSTKMEPQSPNTFVIDCTTPGTPLAGVTYRASSPGISEAPNPRTYSETSSVYSSTSSRASSSDNYRSDGSRHNDTQSRGSGQQSRIRPETTVRPRKPSLPSYLPANRNRRLIKGSRSFNPFPSESTAFSKANTKNRVYPRSDVSTGSVKSLPLSRQSPVVNHHGQKLINVALPRSNSWRELRDDVVLIDVADADERDSELVDHNKLEALLRRIESTKSQLENADDAISQYRMRDLIVNLARSAEELKKIEES